MLRYQIDDSRDRLGRRIVQAFPHVIALACLILISEDGFGTIPDVDIKNVIVTQSIEIRAHAPDPRLFQIFLPDFVPEPTVAERRGDDVEIHGYFEINKTQGFLEVITKGSKERVEVARPFKGHDCFHGYPASRSETCSPTLQAPSTEDEYLGLDWTFDLPKLVAAFHRNGLDPSMHFDLTIVSAKRIMETWNWLDVRAGSSGVKDRMDREQPKQAIVSVTEHSPVGQGGETWLFRTTDYECLGTIMFAASRKLPPVHRVSPMVP